MCPLCYRGWLIQESHSGFDLAQASAEVYMTRCWLNTRMTLLPSIPDPIKVAEGDLISVLRSFPNGSAPGPSGFRAIHFKESIVPLSRPALQAVLEIVYAGHAPSNVVPHLCGALLWERFCVGLPPNVFREQCGVMLSGFLSHCWESPLAAKPSFTLCQGCYNIKHWTLLLEFSNAFNSVNRESRVHAWGGEGSHPFHGCLGGMLLWG